MNDFVYVYVTNPGKDKAEELAAGLLEKRLVACANIFPMTSMYRWEGKIEKTEEYISIFKTSEDLLFDVERYIDENHSYETPCIVKIPVSSNTRYFNWLTGELKRKV